MAANDAEVAPEPGLRCHNCEAAIVSPEITQHIGMLVARLADVGV